MFKILVILIAAYYLVKWMVRLILPHIVKVQMDKFQNQFDQQNSDLNQKRKQKEGHITVENVQPNPTKSKDAGDYVDYEEIK